MLSSLLTYQVCLAELQDTIKMGYLDRHEGGKVTIRRAWKKRFVVLATNKKLYFFTSNSVRHTLDK